MALPNRRGDQEPWLCPADDVVTRMFHGAKYPGASLALDHGRNTHWTRDRALFMWLLATAAAAGLFLGTVAGVIH